MILNQNYPENNPNQPEHSSCRNIAYSEHILCVLEGIQPNHISQYERIETGQKCVLSKDKDTAGSTYQPVLSIDLTGNTSPGFNSIELYSIESAIKLHQPFERKPVNGSVALDWIRSVVLSRGLNQENALITLIADIDDFEAYEALHATNRKNIRLLYRSDSSKIMSPEFIRNKMRPCNFTHNYEIEVPEKQAGKNRIAQLKLYFETIKPARNDVSPETESPDFQTLNCIYIVECPETVPEGEAPIEWKLYTTHTIETVAQAKQCIQWYRTRWFVDKLVFVLKSERLDMESAQQESGCIFR